MKVISGYWALDGAPAGIATLATMQVANVRCPTPVLDAWHAPGDVLAFGSTWWSPQPELAVAACIARHPQTGCAVVADARLDNPAELRVALDVPAPHDAPDSATDHAASIILHAWLRWGEYCVERIDGDFAFAVHDPRRQCLFLARDRMGQRPLYLHHVPGKLLVFGSSAHAVLAHPRVPRDIDEGRIADYLLEVAGGGLEGIDFTSTFHRAVQRQPPRQALRVTAKGGQSRRYWQLEPGRTGPLPGSDTGWAEALADAMECAVRQRLSGPWRAGSMLSGGLDSTSLAIIAADQLHATGRGPLPIFSAIDDSNRDCLETRAIRTALGYPGFEPHLVDIADPGELLPELECFLDEFDEPFDAWMPLLDAQYAHAAALGVDAMFDGGNGDCLFLPGDTVRNQLRAGHWRTAWRNAQGATRYGGHAWRYLRHPLRAALAPDWLRNLLAPWRRRREELDKLARARLHPAFAARVGVEGRLRQLRALHSTVPLSTTARAVEMLMHTFPVVGAERYARVAARHGVTPLTPFTERRLLELCVNLPDRQRLRDGWTKPVLRNAMAGRMPESVRLRCDKQHLGWRLSGILWNRHENLAQRWPSIARTLSPYLAPGPLPPETPVAGHRWSRHLLHVIALERWIVRARED